MKKLLLFLIFIIGISSFGNSFGNDGFIPEKKFENLVTEFLKGNDYKKLSLYSDSKIKRLNITEEQKKDFDLNLLQNLLGKIEENDYKLFSGFEYSFNSGYEELSENKLENIHKINYLYKRIISEKLSKKLVEDFVKEFEKTGAKNISYEIKDLVIFELKYLNEKGENVQKEFMIFPHRIIKEENKYNYCKPEIGFENYKYSTEYRNVTELITKTKEIEIDGKKYLASFKIPKYLEESINLDLENSQYFSPEDFMEYFIFGDKSLDKQLNLKVRFKDNFDLDNIYSEAIISIIYISNGDISEEVKYNFHKDKWGNEIYRSMELKNKMGNYNLFFSYPGYQEPPFCDYLNNFNYGDIRTHAYFFANKINFKEIN